MSDARREQAEWRAMSGYHDCCGMARIRGHHDLCHRNILFDQRGDEDE